MTSRVARTAPMGMPYPLVGIGHNRDPFEDKRQVREVFRLLQHALFEVVKPELNGVFSVEITSFNFSGTASD